ncbi:MAG: OmpA family protein [Betaproteobacteria bacterium]|nr:OmpA family protein [Betaproteobacteria bacterium]
MNLHAKLALGLVIVGGAVMGYLWWGDMLKLDQQQVETSDARATKGHLTIGMDNWIGYLPLCSRAMKQQMRKRGFTLECRDDKADYVARMQALKSGEIQFAAATVDTYLLNGAAKSYPGAIIAVLDESKGGDALVAWKDQLARIEDLKTAPAGTTIAFTPGSPSEHLLKALASHFDISYLKQKTGTWRVETKGSSDALTRLQQKQASAAVLWEPDVSKALAQAGVVKLLGSEDTRRLIVDVLLVSRDFSQKQPQVVNELLTAYFEVLQTYADNREALLSDAKAASGLNEQQTATVLKGVRWASLAENAEIWLGAAGKGQELVEAIEAALQILVDAGDFRDNPLPERDPYRLINSQFLHTLYASAVATNKSLPPLERRFSVLDEAAWNGLREVGALRTRPVQFQSGTADLSLEGKQELDKLAENLKHYPNFRVVVKGHTGVKGDAEENRRLSQDRADAVARYFQVTYNVDANRLRVLGLGGGQPLPRLAGESDRAFGYRLPRVEIVLASEGL